MRWLREPLLHFALLGGLIFWLYGGLEPGRREGRVVVSRAVQQALIDEHLRRYGAPPTAAQTAGLIERWIDDEVRVREALALGLDRGDLIVRRRLIQKMDFVLGSAPLARATDAQLGEYLATHADRYAAPERVWIEQVFAAGDRAGGTNPARVRQWQVQLASGVAPTTLGDPFLHGREFAAQSEADLAGVFGPEFARAVLQLPPGTWSPPLRSSFGWHTVRVVRREPPRAARLEDVRAEVERDWRDERRAALDQSALAALRREYTAVVEPTASGAAQPPASEAGP